MGNSVHSRPRFLIADSPSSAFIDLQKICNVFDAKVSPGANHSDIFRFKLRLPGFFTKNSRSMLKGILFVFGLSSPSKISQMWIKWIAIIVASVMRFAWTRADKSFQNHDMHRTHSSFAKCAEIYRWISFETPICRSDFFFNRSASGRFGSNDPGYSFYASMVTYFVKTFKSYNRLPLFNHSQSQITKAPWEEVRHQHGKLVFGSYPSRTGTLYG